jgi:fucose permease
LLPTIGSFVVFFVFGFVDNLKGPTIPAILSDLGLNYRQGGTVLFSEYIGFLIATLSMGVLSVLLGKKKIVFAAGLFLALGMVLYGSVSRVLFLSIFMACIGFGLGSCEVGGNLIIVDLYRTQKAKYLNIMEFFHGLGSILAPVYSGQLLAAAVSWRQVYKLALLFPLALLLYFLFIRVPRKPPAQGDGGIDIRRIGASALAWDTILFYLFILLYVGAELGVASWLVEFLQKEHGMSVSVSSLLLSAFFVAITAGRLAGSLLVERIGYLRIMKYVSILSAVFLTIGIFAPAPFVYFLPATGLLFSIVFPTATAAVSMRHPEHTGAILGIFFAFAGIGGMVGPYFIGLIGELTTIKWGFSFNILLCVLMFAVLAAIELTNKTRNLKDKDVISIG